MRTPVVVIITLSALIIGSANALWACPTSLQDRFERLVEKLELTDEQSQEVQAIFSTAANTNPCRELETNDDKYGCFLSKREFIRDGLMQVLSDSQLIQLKGIIEEKKDLMRRILEES